VSITSSSRPPISNYFKLKGYELFFPFLWGEEKRVFDYLILVALTRRRNGRGFSTEIIAFLCTQIICCR
jgi:hypothetical protein